MDILVTLSRLILSGTDVLLIDTGGFFSPSFFHVHMTAERLMGGSGLV